MTQAATVNLRFCVEMIALFRSEKAYFFKIEKSSAEGIFGDVSIWEWFF